MSWTVAFPAIALRLWFGLMLQAQVPAGPAAAGETSVQNWKDGKKAVFFMAFDDSCPSHLDNAIPAREKHGLVGNLEKEISADK